jgi:hypothetical protein
LLVPALARDIPWPDTACLGRARCERSCWWCSSSAAAATAWPSGAWPRASGLDDPDCEEVELTECCVGVYDPTADIDARASCDVLTDVVPSGEVVAACEAALAEPDCFPADQGGGARRPGACDWADPLPD